MASISQQSAYGTQVFMQDRTDPVGRVYEEEYAWSHNTAETAGVSHQAPTACAATGLGQVGPGFLDQLPPSECNIPGQIQASRHHSTFPGRSLHLTKTVSDPRNEIDSSVEEALQMGFEFFADDIVHPFATNNACHP